MMQESNDSEWVAEGAAAPSGCVLIVEGTPPPGASMGHMSFHSFNPELQKLQVTPAAFLSCRRCVGC